MRDAFIETLFNLATQDKRITLIVGDLGFGVVTRFAKELPQQFINAGVAEQNMTGLALGMAISGRIAFTYSIANFPVIRCLEQVRNDVCYHNANVKIVSVGGGLGYGALGMSHHGTEDMAILRGLPNMKIVVPGDIIEAKLATQAIVSEPGPFYLRLGRTGKPAVHKETVPFKIGKAIEVRKGNDLTIITTGGCLWDVIETAELLSKEGVNARILSMHTIKPIDKTAILAAAQETRKIITVEDHNIIGGLGGAVAEVLAESNLSQVYFKRMGVPDVYTSKVGDQDYLKKFYNLHPEGLLKSIKIFLNTIKN